MKQKILPFLLSKFKELFGADLRSLALLRVGVGTLTLVDLICRARNLVAHYTDVGLISRSEAMARNSEYVFSLHYLSGTWLLQAALFVIAFTFAIFLIVGYKTRLSTVITWLLLISIQARNPAILQGSDVLHRILLFWGMFLPWGQRYSLDSLKQGIKTKSSTLLASFAVSAYFLQIAFVYIFNALHKSGETWTTQGSAIYYALSLDQFATPFTQFLYAQPALMRGMTHYIWFLELLGPLLLFCPIFTKYIRVIAAVLLMSMHIGIGTNMTVGLFPLLDIVSLTAFLTPWFWDTLLSFLNKFKRFTVIVYYDGECGFCKRSVQIIKTFILLPKTGIFSALNNASVKNEMIKNNSWVIVDTNGNNHFKWDGATTLISASPLLFWLTPFLKLSPVSFLGNKAYEFVATHRKTACPIVDPKNITAFPVVNQKATRFKFFASSILAVFFIIYILIWNLGTLPNSTIRMNPEYQWIGVTLRIDQAWNMFSPYPLTEDGWYTIVGTHENGSKVNLLEEGKAVSFDRPTNMNPYPNNHWRKFLMEMYLSGHTNDRQVYADYLCRKWNNLDNKQPRLSSVEVFFTPEFTKDNYENEIGQRELLAEKECQ